MVGGGVQDYGFRLYSPAMGRFLSVDPISSSYPMLTPYQFASNTPIQAIDLDGLEGHPSYVRPPGSDLPTIQAVDNTSIGRVVQLYEFARTPPPTKTYIGPAYDRLTPVRSTLLGEDSAYGGYFDRFADAFRSTAGRAATGAIAADASSELLSHVGSRITTARSAAGYRYFPTFGTDIPISTNTDMGIRLFEQSEVPRGGTGLSRAGRIAGRVGIGLSAASMVVDGYAYSQGEISGSRLTYRAISTVGALAVGARFGGPAGIATSVVLTAGEYLYDNPPTGGDGPILDEAEMSDQFRQIETATDNPDFFSNGPQ